MTPGTTLGRRALTRLTPWLFMLPALLIYTCFRVVPILASTGLSLTHFQGVGSPSFAGLANYVQLFQNASFWLALRNNLIWAVVDVGGTTCIGLGLALLLNSRIRLRALFRTTLFIPFVLSWVTVSMVWTRIYNPIPATGLLNHVLQAIGHPEWMHNWLGAADTALASVLVMAVWKSFGFPMVIFLAGLQNIPEEVVEAARIDGAAARHIFWHVTLPLLRPITSIVVVLGLIGSFRVFDPVWVATQGGPGSASTVLGVQVYETAFRDFNIGFGSAYAVVLLLCALLATAVYLGLFGREGVTR